MEDTNKAANTVAENEAAKATENPASSENTSAENTASANKQNIAPAQQENAAEQANDDVTKTQAFAKRLKEETDKIRVSIEKEFSEKPSVPEVKLTSEEKSALKVKRQQLQKQLTDGGTDPTLAYQMAKDEETEQRESLLETKRATARKEAEQKAAEEKQKSDFASKDERIKALEAENAELKAGKEADISNKTAAAASVGSLAGEPAEEKDYISSQEWDKASPEVKAKWYKDPKKLMKCMAKWGK